MPGPMAMPFVEDTYLFATRGMAGATGNWYCGLHEAAEMGFALHFLRPGDLFLDVGANIGSYSILAAGGVGTQVIAVEPIPATFAKLNRNVLLNGLAARIESHCIGLANEKSTLSFTQDQDTINHVAAVTETHSSLQLPVTTMDMLLAGRVPAVIKIDVEGYEHSVMAGATMTLSNPGVAAVIMELNGSGARYGISDDKLLAQMREFGFTPYTYDPRLRYLKDWSHSCDNAIFVRDPRTINDRTTQSTRYRLVTGTI